MATVSQGGCPMVTIPLPSDYDSSAMPLHHPGEAEQLVSAGHTVDSLPYDGTMVEAFSLTGHEFPAITSCSQQGSLMSTAPYQSNTPIVLEVPPTQQLGGTERMKRKRRKGLSQEQGVEASGSSTSADYSDNLPPSGEVYSMEPPPTESSYAQTDTPPQKLTWQAFIVDSWAMMCDPTLQPINSSDIDFTVEAEKGFFYSPVDECFVCQKKNHFQVTAELRMQQTPKYLTTPGGGVEPIQKLALHLHGIKFEALSSIIQIEQSKPDRTKTHYEPIPIEISVEKSVRVSACRLHFSETTANNMRKRGKPNPDQRHFALVVSVHAYTQNGDYPVVAHVSERIIVRASNPGNFDNDVDYSWTRGSSTDTICHFGKIGVNTDSPEEALTVVGNVQVTGQILQPSDVRLKTDIMKMNTAQMLDNISKLNLYHYRFKNGTDGGMGTQQGTGRWGRGEVGLLAQEVETVIPEAVHHAKSPHEVLLLNKDRVLMECVGAIQELIKVMTQHKQW